MCHAAIINKRQLSEMTCYNIIFRPNLIKLANLFEKQGQELGADHSFPLCYEESKIIRRLKLNSQDP